MRISCVDLVQRRVVRRSLAGVTRAGGAEEPRVLLIMSCVAMTYSLVAASEMAARHCDGKVLRAWPKINP